MESSTGSRKRERGPPPPQEPSSAPASWLLLQRLVDPDFEELANQFPAFRTAWRQVQQSQQRTSSSAKDGKHSHNNKTKNNLAAHVTQEFSIALTKALLEVHFGIGLVEVPLQHLCPPVPNRYYYVHWIHTVLLPLLSNPQHFHFQPPSNQDTSTTTRISTVVGLDIGTGAVAIYPLLFCATHPQRHRMYGTDISSESIVLAQNNVQHGNPRLASRIHLQLVPASDRQQQQQNSQPITATPMIDDDNDPVQMTVEEQPSPPVGPLRRSLECIPFQQQLTFCMTNPPFYDSNHTKTDNHSHSPWTAPPRQGDGRSRTAMTTQEGSYPGGGEVGFVMDMIVDGLFLHLQQANSSSSATTAPLLQLLQRPPIWSSTMCGKKASWTLLHHVVTQLLGPARVCSTEFGPGQLTRWFLAWTLDPQCRPCATSPLAQLKDWTFVVAVPPDAQDTTTVAEFDYSALVHRLEEYCRTLPDAHLGILQQSTTTTAATHTRRRLQICEQIIAPPPWKDDDVLPEPLRSMVRTMDPAVRLEFLPPQGHLLLNITLTQIVPGATTMTTTATHPSVSTVQVHVEAYQHSAYGKMLVEKIKSQLEGELTRTNRRWRRQLQREQQQQGTTAISSSSMDES